MQTVNLRPRDDLLDTSLGVYIAEPIRWAALQVALRCPLSHVPLVDPVILSNGVTYDREAAMKFGETVMDKGRPNLAMRQLLQQLCEEDIEGLGPGQEHSAQVSMFLGP